MSFIVEPLEVKNPEPEKLDHTMCVLCSEDPRWCI